MKKSKRLEPILDLADRKEKDSAKLVAIQLKKVQAISKGAADLRGYLDNYHARYQTAGATGFTVKQLTEYRLFLAKINGAIDEQLSNLRLAEQELADCRRAWEEARQYREGVRKLFNQARLDEERLAEKNEQKEMDERAANKVSRKSNFAD